MKYILEVFTGLNADEAVVGAFGAYNRKLEGAKAEPPTDVGFDGPYVAYAYYRDTEEECNKLLDGGKMALFGVEDCAFFIHSAPDTVELKTVIHCDEQMVAGFMEVNGVGRDKVERFPEGSNIPPAPMVELAVAIANGSDMGSPEADTISFNDSKGLVASMLELVHWKYETLYYWTAEYPDRLVVVTNPR